MRKLLLLLVILVLGCANPNTGKGEIEHNPVLIAQLKIHEGFSEKRYKSCGRTTIGFGHDLKTKPIKGLCSTCKISENKAHDVLKQDIKAVVIELDKKIPWWRKENPARQAAIINLAFNVGTNGFFLFRKSLRYIKEKKYTLASKELLRSKWAKQTGKRARDIAYQIRYGKWKTLNL